MIGHRGRFRENDDLPLWRGPAVNAKENSSSQKLALSAPFRVLTGFWPEVS